jgi:hypothetical protein
MSDGSVLSDRDLLGQNITTPYECNVQRDGWHRVFWSSTKQEYFTARNGKLTKLSDYQRRNTRDVGTKVHVRLPQGY